MGVVLLLFNISRPRRLFELSNVTHMASRTLAENSPKCLGFDNGSFRDGLGECGARDIRILGERYL